MTVRAMTDSGYASLGPTLLARKGGAKPAMRPQLPVIGDPADVSQLAEEHLDDLGWNDMGEDREQDTGAHDPAAVVVPIDPATPFDPAAAAATSPIVRRQQRRLEERVLADAVMTGPEDSDAEDREAAEHNALPATGSAGEPSAAPSIPRAARSQSARRAAFTLRLDPERHLKLRLAATMQGVSAQVLLTDALDALLAEFKELDHIAARIQRH